MKICRFNGGLLGVVQGEWVLDVSSVLELLPPQRYPLPQKDLLIEALPHLMAPLAQAAAGAQRHAISDVRFDAPVANPGKIIGAPINYRAHADESQQDAGIAHGRTITSIADWGLFLKAGSSLIGCGQDIALRAGDRIIVQEDTRTFTALGATGTQNRVPFESQAISAIEAIAQVGGLSTAAADPTGVFVFRNEPEAIARQLVGRDDLTGTQRVVYVLDLTRPNGMFMARDFAIRDGDTVYVTEAPFVTFNKTIAAITGTLATVDTAATLGSGG